MMMQLMIIALLVGTSHSWGWGHGDYRQQPVYPAALTAWVPLGRLVVNVTLNLDPTVYSNTVGPTFSSLQNYLAQAGVQVSSANGGTQVVFTNYFYASTIVEFLRTAQNNTAANDFVSITDQGSATTYTSGPNDFVIYMVASTPRTLAAKVPNKANLNLVLNWIADEFADAIEDVVERAIESTLTSLP